MRRSVHEGRLCSCQPLQPDPPQSCQVSLLPFGQTERRKRGRTIIDVAPGCRKRGPSSPRRNRVEVARHAIPVCCASSPEAVRAKGEALQSQARCDVCPALAKAVLREAQEFVAWLLVGTQIAKANQRHVIIDDDGLIDAESRSSFCGMKREHSLLAVLLQKNIAALQREK